MKSSLLERIRARPGLTRILSNTSWMMAEQIIRMAVNLVVSVLIARHLGPAQFGQLSYAIALTSLLAIVGTLGLNRISVRELVECGADVERRLNLLSNVYALRCFVGAGLTLLCLVLAWALGNSAPVIVAILAPTLMFRPADTVELYFQSQTQAKNTTKARTAAFLAVTVIRLLLLKWNAGLTAFAIVATLEVVLGALALIWIYHRAGMSFRWHGLDKALMKRLLKESWPEIIAGFSGLLFMRMDQLMLEHMAGAAQVGMFAVAARLSESWFFVPSAIVASTFPSIVRERERNHALYLRRISQLMVALTGLSYTAALATGLLSGPIIGLLYGPAYADAATILAIHIWCGLFVSFGLASGSWLMSERLVRLNLYRNLAGAVVNVVLNVVLIPRHGAVGAAWATLMSLALAHFLFVGLHPRARSIFVLQLKALTLRTART